MSRTKHPPWNTCDRLCMAIDILRVCSHGGGGPREGENTPSTWGQKNLAFTCNPGVGSRGRWVRMSTNMADGRHFLAANAIFLSLAAFQLCGLILIYLILERLRIQRMGLEAANQYNIPVARLRHMQRRQVYRGRVWQWPEHTEQWWLNLYNGVLPESEWSKNLRMDRDTFMVLADELLPYLESGRSPRGGMSCQSKNKWRILAKVYSFANFVLSLHKKHPLTPITLYFRTML